MNTLSPSSPPVPNALQDATFKTTAATSPFNNEQPLTARFADFIGTNFVSLLESFSLLLMTMVMLAELEEYLAYKEYFILIFLFPLFICYYFI